MQVAQQDPPIEPAQAALKVEMKGTDGPDYGAGILKSSTFQVSKRVSCRSRVLKCRWLALVGSPYQAGPEVNVSSRLPRLLPTTVSPVGRYRRVQPRHVATIAVGTVQSPS
jgi:hypothetical protein